MYSFDILPQAREQANALPAKALPCYAELLVFLELTPWAGSPYKDDEPAGTMRTQPFGPAGTLPTTTMDEILSRRHEHNARCPCGS
ncbi:MAG: hypothetical protein ACRDTF_13580 [Pseudonocardiaceae bacterium]